MKTAACSNEPQSMHGTLLVIAGPTGVGKTELSLSLAERLGSPIINADSRQLYREIPIGTAAPTPAELARVQHYFVGTHSVTEDYNAGQYERDALSLLEQLFLTHDTIVLTGGSMLYIDAVCRGFDDIPQASSALRQQVQEQYRAQGIGWLQTEVERLDPDYYAIVDQQNPQRLLHALEVTLAAGKPYSAYRTGAKKTRSFRIIKVLLTRDRSELYARIDKRVDSMLAQGMEEEARRVYPLRACNALHTVGYNELFSYFDGSISREEAIRLIKQNSRHYAKRQLTWYRSADDIHPFDLSQDTPEHILTNILALTQQQNTPLS